MSDEVILTESATLSDVVSAVNDLASSVNKHTAEEGRVIGKALATAMGNHAAELHADDKQQSRLLHALTDRLLGSPAPDYEITGERNADGMEGQVAEIKKATDLFLHQQANGGTNAALSDSVLAALISNKGETERARFSRSEKIWLAAIGAAATLTTTVMTYLLTGREIAEAVTTTLP